MSLEKLAQCIKYHMTLNTLSSVVSHQLSPKISPNSTPPYQKSKFLLPQRSLL